MTKPTDLTEPRREPSLACDDVIATVRSYMDWEQDFATAGELAARLRLDIKTVRSLAASGELPAIRVGRSWRFSYPAVMELFGRSGDAPELEFGPDGHDVDILTTEELARRLGASSQTIRNMITVAGLPAVRLGKNYRYSHSTVMTWLAHQPDEPPVAPPRRCPTCGQPLSAAVQPSDERTVPDDVADATA